MKTYSAKKGEVQAKWYIIDAQDVILGRLASFVADRLRGKHKPQFTAHINTGDSIIVINAEKVKITGRKMQQSIFYWHTGFPGGIKGRSQGAILEGKHPERVIIKAVERMVPRGVLGREQMSNLKVYAGTEHPHVAQQPEVIDFASLNPKNKR